MSTSARPRPRPRARPRLDIPSIEGANGVVFPAAGSSKSPIEVLEDEDAMFMRNRNISLLSRKTIEEVIEKREALAPESPSNSELSDPDEGGRSPKRRNRKAHKLRVKPLPAWVTSEGRKKLFELSHDEESNDDLYMPDGSPHNKSVEKTPQPKHKRERSRSPSLTPPPPVPIHRIQNAQAIMRQALGNPVPRQASPTLVIGDDLDDDPIVLAPELAKITAEYKEKRTSSRQRSIGLGSDADPTSSAEVKLRIKWLPHPEDEAGKVEFWEFRQRRNESFRNLLEEIADEAGILSSDLKLTCNGAHVYPVSTPQSLGIWSEALLEACTSNTREYIDNEKKTRALSPSKAVVEIMEVGSFLDTPVTHDPGAESDASQSKEDEDKFKLHLRNGDTTIVVTVRPTTKCSSIVATFLRKTNRSASLAKQVRVEIDGEKKNPNSIIGDVELEDGDLVDIVGL